MPCSPQKARRLLTAGKARVETRTPFTIRLTQATGETVQPVTLGVDSGYKYIGLSAVTGKKELYCAEICLRDDIVKLNSERRQYRLARRGRKTWYRQPRFLNRRKPEGWLAPSMQHKLDSHVKMIGKVSKLLPISGIIVEVASFDIQRIMNPEIEGEAYQNGPQKEYANVREYVLYRDSHTCRHCKGKSKDKRLEVHHLESRQTGGNRPDNLVTLCLACHESVSKGTLKLTIAPSRGFKAEAFMTMVRWRLIEQLRAAGYSVRHTFGYLTKLGRHSLGLVKSHGNDAFVIAGGSFQARVTCGYSINQVRKCNRKLFKGERSHIKNTAPRFLHGFLRYDKVRYRGVECFIFGRRATGYFDLRTLDGAKIHASAKATDCSLLERARTLLIERRPALLPTLTDGVSASGK